MSRLGLMLLYKERILIYTLLSLFIIFGFETLLNQMQVIKSDYTPKIAYYNGSDNQNLTKKLDEQGIEYDYGMIKYPTKSDQIVEKYQIFDSIDQEVNLRELEYIDQSTSDLASSNDNQILSGNPSQKFSLSYMFYPDFIGGTSFPIDSAATKLISGSLPSNSDEIIIPENYALYLVNKDNTVKSYDDLIGMKLKLSKNGTKREFKISSVATGNVFSILPNEKMKDNLLKDNPKLGKAVYIKFNSTNQRDAFVRNSDIDLQINTIWNYRNLTPLIIARTLNHNYVRLGNYVLPWLLPFLIINTIYFLI